MSSPAAPLHSGDDPPASDLTTATAEGALIVRPGGRWDLAAAERLRVLVAAVPADGGNRVRIDLSQLATLDTVGALMLRHLRDRLTAAGCRVEVVAVRPAHLGLLDLVWRAAEQPPTAPPLGEGFRDNVALVGAAATRGLSVAVELVTFFGLVSATLGRILINPRRIRLAPVFYHLEHVGLRALPILGLLSFLVGVVLGYQGIEQLEKVGAESLVVELLGMSMLREVGGLLAAIIVAGRSGSAFTAQIGTMKVTQEVDALQTIGLDPIELLVIPRILALLIALPILTFYANVVGLLGGASMTYLVFEMNFLEFFRDLSIPLDIFDASLGLVKSPAFALVIAIVGCHEGMKVTGSAESVGLHTTRSVVQSIFLVIVFNALFSVIATAMRI